MVLTRLALPSTALPLLYRDKGGLDGLHSEAARVVGSGGGCGRVERHSNTPWGWCHRCDWKVLLSAHLLNTGLRGVTT